MRRWYSFLRDIGFGLHSGIPWCCVLAFLRDHYVRDITPVAHRRWADAGLDFETALTGVHYVPCERCLAALVQQRRPPALVCRCGARETLACRFWEWESGLWTRRRASDPT